MEKWTKTTGLAQIESGLGHILWSKKGVHLSVTERPTIEGKLDGAADTRIATPIYLHRKRCVDANPLSESQNTANTQRGLWDTTFVWQAGINASVAVRANAQFSIDWGERVF